MPVEWQELARGLNRVQSTGDARRAADVTLADCERARRAAAELPFWGSPHASAAESRARLDGACTRVRSARPAGGRASDPVGPTWGTTLKPAIHDAYQEIAFIDGVLERADRLSYAAEFATVAREYDRAVRGGLERVVEGVSAVGSSLIRGTERGLKAAGDGLGALGWILPLAGAAIVYVLLARRFGLPLPRLQ